jgi:hypothetical protein
MFLWLGLGLSPEFTQSVFGAQCTQQIDTERCGLPVFDNPLSRRVRGIVDKIQEEKSRCMRVSFCLSDFYPCQKKGLYLGKLNKRFGYKVYF